MRPQLNMHKQDRFSSAFLAATVDSPSNPVRREVASSVSTTEAVRFFYLE